MVPYGRQLIEADDEAAVLAVLRSDFLTQGSQTRAFEEALAARVGARYCVAVSSATAALHIAYAALGLSDGEGITSPITFVATSNAMAYAGVTPVFADIDPETFNLSPQAFENAITERTRLVAPVHLAGLPPDMEAISKIARARGIRIVEDASHAVGSRYPDGRPVGGCAHSDATVFSFHPVKTITTGEGGAVTTNDADVYERLSHLRSHGLVRGVAHAPGPWYYEQQMLGFNYRMCELQAALGVTQLAKLDRFLARRREIIAMYRERLGGLNWLKLPAHFPDQQVCYHLFVLRLDFAALGKSRADVMAELSAKGVGTQVHYIPVHTQPYYRETYATRAEAHPNALAYYEQCLSIPLHPGMSQDDVERVAKAVRELR